MKSLTTAVFVLASSMVQSPAWSQTAGGAAAGAGPADATSKVTWTGPLEILKAKTFDSGVSVLCYGFCEASVYDNGTVKVRFTGAGAHQANVSSGKTPNLLIVQDGSTETSYRVPAGTTSTLGPTGEYGVPVTTVISSADALKPRSIANPPQPAAPGLGAAIAAAPSAGISILTTTPVASGTQTGATVNPPPATPAPATTYTQHISALGAWKDPTSGATIGCPSDCTVKFTKESPGAYTITYDDGVVRKPNVTTAGSSISLNLVGNDPAAGELLKIDPNMVGMSLLGSPWKQVSADKVPVQHSGVSRVVSIAAGGNATLAGDTQVTCNVACYATLSTDGNIKVVSSDKSNGMTLTPTVTSPRKIDVSVVNNLSEVTYQLPGGVATTLSSADKSLTQVSHAPSAGSTSSGNTISLYNGSAVDCSSTCNAVASATSAATGTKSKLSTQLGANTQTVLPGGPTALCSVACKIEMAEDGSVHLTVEGSLRSADAIKIANVKSGTPIVIEGGGISQSWTIGGGGSLQLENGKLMGVEGSLADNFQGPALSSVQVPAGTTYVLPSGTLIKCTTKCVVTSEHSGFYTVKTPYEDKSAKVEVISARETDTIGIDMNGTGPKYPLVKSGYKYTYSGYQSDEFVEYKYHVNSNGVIADLPPGVSVNCNLSCDVHVADDGSLSVRAVNGDNENLTVNVANHNGNPIKVNLATGDGTRTYLVAVGYERFVGAIPESSSTTLVNSSSTLDLYAANGVLDKVPNAQRAEIKAELEKLAGHEALLKKYAELKGLDEDMVLRMYGPNSEYAKKVALWVATNDTNARDFDAALRSLTDMLATLQGPASDTRFLQSIASTSGPTAYQPNEDTNADGTASALAGSVSTTPVGAWPAVVVAADASLTSVGTVTPLLSSGASHVLASDGALASFSMGTGLDSGSTTTAGVCTGSQCRQPGTIRWGAWGSGSAFVSASPITVNSNNQLHYIIGSATDPAVITARTGTVSYSHIGGTIPTGSDGSTYTATAGPMSIVFNGTSSFTGTLSSYTLTPRSGGGSSHSFSAILLTGDANSSPGVATLFGTGSTGPDSLTVHGAFFGSEGNHVGAAMAVHDGTSGANINSVQVFKH